MQALMERSHRNHISCPVCRTNVPLSSVSYVYGGGSSDLDMSNVLGNFSIKILAITAKVMELTAEDPTVKILVFSTVSRLGTSQINISEITKSTNTCTFSVGSNPQHH